MLRKFMLIKTNKLCKFVRNVLGGEREIIYKENSFACRAPHKNTYVILMELFVVRERVERGKLTPFLLNKEGKESF